MKQTLSSSITIVFKIILPLSWLLFFGYGVFVLFLDNYQEKWIFLFIWILGSIFLYLYGFRLKKVGIDENSIFISNYINEIRVPLSEISKVTENIFFNIHPIWVSFQTKNDFGKKIIFMPPPEFLLFQSHPVKKILQNARDSCKRKKAPFR